MTMRDDDDSDEYSERGHPDEERRGRDPVRGQPRGRLLRRLSADQTNYQSGFVSHHSEGLPTPPYSPMYSPSMTPLRRSPNASRNSSIITPIQYDDSPADSQDDIRRMREHSSESSPLRLLRRRRMLNSGRS